MTGAGSLRDARHVARDKARRHKGAHRPSRQARIDASRLMRGAGKPFVHPRDRMTEEQRLQKVKK